MRFLLISLFILLSGIVFPESSLLLMNIYNKTRYFDYTSSRIRYEAEAYGIRLGALRSNNRFNNDLVFDYSSGLSSKGGYDYVSDRPFYISLSGEYIFTYDYLIFGKSVLFSVGPGVTYDLEGIVPGDLYGANLSWIQVFGLSLHHRLKYYFENGQFLQFSLSSPFWGTMNRPSWAGSIDKEIDDLADESYLDVLMKRGIYFSYHNYFQLQASVAFKSKLNSFMDYYILNEIVYAYTYEPRYYTRLTNKLVFGVLFYVKDG